MQYVVLHGLSFCGLLVVFYCSGFVIDALLGREPPTAYRHLTRFTLGFLLWIVFLFAAATAGLLNRGAVWAAIVALAAGTAVAWWRRRDRPARDRRSRGQDLLGSLGPSSVVPAAAIVVVCGALLLLALRPTLAWDADTYHLTLPRLYIEHGGFRPIPYNVYSNWPLNVELLFALGMLLHDYVLSTSIQLLFALLVVGALASLAGVHGAPWAGAVASCLFLANDVVLVEIASAYVDVASAFFFLMAVCFLLETDRTAEGLDRNWLLAGICCGLMAGIKLNGVFGILAILALIWSPRWRAGDLRREALRATLVAVLPCSVLALPWFVKSAWYTGNPLYPLLYETFGGIEWNETLGRQFMAWHRSIGMGRSLEDYLLLPVRLILESGSGYEAFGGRIAVSWIVLVPIVIVASRIDRVVRRLGLAALVYFVGWALTSQQMRFLIPVLAVLAAAAALSLRRLACALEERLHAPVEWAAGLAASLLLLASSSPFLSDAGRCLRLYRSLGSRIAQSAIPPMHAFINRELPADARVMFLNTNHGFFCERDYIADSFFEASQMNALLGQDPTVEGIAETLRRHRVTHVLLANEPKRIPFPEALGAFLADPRRSRLLYSVPDGDRLFEVGTDAN
jgi:hypothetical protein